MFRTSKKRGGTERDGSVAENTSEKSLPSKKCKQDCGMTRGEFLDIAAILLLAGCMPVKSPGGTSPSETTESLTKYPSNENNNEGGSATNTPVPAKIETPSAKNAYPDSATNFNLNSGGSTVDTRKFIEEENKQGLEWMETVIKGRIWLQKNDELSAQGQDRMPMEQTEDYFNNNFSFRYGVDKRTKGWTVVAQNTQSGNFWIPQVDIGGGIKANVLQLMPLDATSMDDFSLVELPSPEGTRPVITSDSKSGHLVTVFVDQEGKTTAWFNALNNEISTKGLESVGPTEEKRTLDQMTDEEIKKLSSEELHALSPEKAGYLKETSVENGVVAHDTGRYVVYIDNWETNEEGVVNPNKGRVGMVFDTEKRSFERAARSVYTTEVDGRSVSIPALFVTSVKYQDKFGDYLEIREEDEGRFAKQFLTTAAVNHYDQKANGGPHDVAEGEAVYSTANLSDSERDELVRVCVEGGTFSGNGYPKRDFGGGYLRDVVLAGQEVTLQGMHVRPDAFVFKIGYDRNVKMGGMVVAMDGGGLVHTKSEDGAFTLKFNTSQDLLSPVAWDGCNETGCYDFLTYPELGWIVQAINTIGENKLLYGRLGKAPSFPHSLFRGIMRYSYGQGDYINGPINARRSGDYNPQNIDFPPLVGLPALGKAYGGTGDWLGGVMVEGS